MRGPIRRSALVAALVVALGLPLAASASVSDAVSSFTYTKNMHPKGFSERAVPLSGPGSGIVNSDLAFWGKYAVQGTYEGFRVIDISEPDNPVEVENFTGCVQGTTDGNQGDVIVWDDVLVRSWNSPAPAGGATCGGVATPAFQEGLHVFDISDPANPQGLAFVATPCGSHTASGVPDLANNRLLVYNSPSAGTQGCEGIDIVEVPLGDPSDASYLRFEPSGNPFGLFVTIDPPSSAAGTYGAAGASFGPPPSATGTSGSLSLANDGTAPTADGCQPFVGFPSGSIAVVDRGQCNFTVKVKNAQNAGAVAAIVVNNVPGPPGGMGGTDPTITIPSVMVSLDDGTTIKNGLPANGRIFGTPPPPDPERSCHDTGVILGDVLRAACAGGNGFSVWSLDPAEGGSLTDPKLLYSRPVDGVTIGHSAAFSWDGEVLVFGHEPGGGTQARCQASSSTVDRTLFFVDPDTGNTVGTFVHPRPQTATENCTWHNYNVVPTDKRYVLVSGNYQSGLSVIDFTNPSSPTEVAYADPAPLSETELITGGDWSTYWYDGRIYESDIRRGLIIWDLSGNVVAGAKKLRHLNPQTQETSLP
jgi:hypothetical protein